MSAERCGFLEQRKPGDSYALWPYGARVRFAFLLHNANYGRGNLFATFGGFILFSVMSFSRILSIRCHRPDVTQNGEGDFSVDNRAAVNELRAPAASPAGQMSSFETVEFSQISLPSVFALLNYPLQLSRPGRVTDG